MEPKKFVWDSKMKHKVELMIILLVITVIGNITVYYFNHKYENDRKYAKSEEIVRQPTGPATQISPTDVPPDSQSAIIRDCDLYKTTDYTFCLPKNWIATVLNATTVQFQPKSIPAGSPVNYLTVQTTLVKLTPFPTPLKTYTEYARVTVGTTQAYKTEYIPQKSKDGFVIPLATGCQDPVEILVPTKKKTLRITSCKQYEDIIKPLLESFLIP